VIDKYLLINTSLYYSSAIVTKMNLININISDLLMGEVKFIYFTFIIFLLLEVQFF